MKNNIELIEEELSNIEIVGEEDEIIDKYYDEVKRIASKYGYEANVHDFDHERIYKKGYEDLEDWEEAYIMSLNWTMEELKENEGGDMIYKLTVQTIVNKDGVIYNVK